MKAAANLARPTIHFYPKSELPEGDYSLSYSYRPPGGTWELVEKRVRIDGSGRFKISVKAGDEITRPYLTVDYVP